jgi:hypothetical protein
MSRTVLFLSTALLMVPFASLLAQRRPPVGVGDRVRITHDGGTAATYSDGRRIDCTDTEATVNGVTSDNITLALYGQGTPISVSFASMTSLEVDRGQRGRVRRGMRMGLAIGGGGGALLGAIATPSECPMGPDPCKAYGTAVGAIVGGMVGLVVGGVASAFIQTDRWEEVPLDRLRVSLAPKRDGFAFGIRFAF